MDFMNDKIRASAREPKPDFPDEFPTDFLEVNLFESLGQIVDMIKTTKEILSTLSLSKGLGSKGLFDPLEHYPMDNDELNILITEIESLATDLTDVAKAYPGVKTEKEIFSIRYNVIQKWNSKKAGAKIRGQLKILNKLIADAMRKTKNPN